MIDCLFTWDTRAASVKRVRTICFDNEAIGLLRHWYEDENVYFSIQTKLKDPIEF